MYGAVEREIARELLSTDVGNYQEVKAVRAQEKIDKLIKRLNREAIRWSKVAVPEAYEEGYDVSRTRLEILGAERDEEFNDRTHKQTVDFETDEMVDTLIRANQSIKMNVGMYFYLVRQTAQGLMQIQEFDFRDEEFISGLLDDAIIAGESRGRVKKLVTTHIKGEVGEGKFIQIRGRNYNMKKYADTVAKTRLRHVQTESVLNSCKEYKNDLVEVSDHGTDCIICIPYEGNIYSLSGKHPTYPYIEAYTPFHPRCQHHIRPTSEVALGLRDKQPSWKPSGTLEQANEWANESIVKQTLFHGTSVSNVSSIKSGGFSVTRMHGGAFGDGVYLTPSRGEASVYGKLLELKINVKSLYRVTSKGDYDKLWGWMKQSHKVATTPIGRTKAFHKLMRKYGYDGVAVGSEGNESMFVIFNPKNIMIIGQR